MTNVLIIDGAHKIKGKILSLQKDIIVCELFPHALFDVNEMCKKETLDVEIQLEKYIFKLKAGVISYCENIKTLGLKLPMQVIGETDKQ